MTRTIRGQEVNIDPHKKTVEVVIHKPLNNAYSLSDGVFGYLGKGYVVKVRLPQGEQVLSDLDCPFKVESVPSKFPNYPPWYRYWFMIVKRRREQMELFNAL